MNDFYEEAVKRLKDVPGVRSVSLSRHGLVSRARTRTDVSIAGSSSTVNVYVHYVAPEYFATMGIPLLAGRDLTWRDRERAPEVAIVNRSLAEQFSSKGWPIGSRLGPPEAADQLQVVGVAADARFSNLRDAPPPTLYLPYRQHPQHEMTFAIRFSGDLDGVVAPIRRTIAEIDPNVPMFGIRTQEAQIDLAVGPNRLFARLVSAFAALALLLACLGIYGTLAYSVTRRTSEIGLRMALGARPSNIIRLVLRESLIPVVIGAALGLAGASASTRLIESMLFGLTPHDALTFLAAALALVASALVAAWLPSRRAAHIDPMSALRCE
ncbi:MAG: FtsX-like permease family protein [Vicinamibacteraceae bacterium]